MGFKIATTIICVALGVSAIYFFISACVQIHLKWVDKAEPMYYNLHALEYPTAVTGLSLVPFSTPALPSRLASAWEIRDAFKLPTSALATIDSWFYPTMETSLGMYELLKDGTKPAGSSCVACDAQKTFTLSNVIVEEQMQHYCPKRGESRSDWIVRTQQTRSDSIDKVFASYTNFNYNNEHSEMCRAKGVPSMVLAHVASNTITLFSSQNEKILLMYVGIVNTLFSTAIVLYRWHGSRLQESHIQQKFELHGLFSFLFFVVGLLSMIPLFTDFYERGDGRAEGANRAIGSYVLGMWSIVFTFMYIKVFPLLIPPHSNEDSEKGQTHAVAQPDPETTEPPESTNDEIIVMKFISRQPMISFAYWNLMQIPIMVMLALTTTRYDVDITTQFVIFGAIAVGLLDILNARVIVILAVLRETSGMKGTDALKLHWFVWVFFLAAKLCFAVPVGMRLAQSAVSAASLAVISLLFISQTLQNGAVLTIIQGKAYKALKDYIDAHDYAFLGGALLHLFVTVTSYIIFYA